MKTFKIRLGKIMGLILRISLLLAFFFSGFLISCSMFTSQEDSLTKYKVKFARVLNTELGKFDQYPISFGSLEPPIVGTCYQIVGMIKIDPVYWFSISEIEKEAIIFHEMVHCYCGFLHQEGNRKDGCPKSLMAPKATTKACLEKHWSEYMEDFREKCK